MADRVALTDAHDDTIAESFQVVCPVFWGLYYVMQQLNCLSMLDLEVMIIAHGFGQVLMDLLPQHPPSRRIIHEKDVVAFPNHLANLILWTITGNGASFLQELLDDAAICENHCCRGPQFESVHAPILFCPFGEPVSLSLKIEAILYMGTY